MFLAFAFLGFLCVLSMFSPLFILKTLFSFPCLQKKKTCVIFLRVAFGCLSLSLERRMRSTGFCLLGLASWFRSVSSSVVRKQSMVFVGYRDLQGFVC